MKTPIFAMLTTAILGVSLLSAPSFLQAQERDAQKQAKTKQRIFLFVGEPNASAWKFLIDNPSDREAVMGKALKKLGGEILSYHWGLGNGKNYITISLPDDKTLIQATYVTRLGDGLLISDECIELLTSKEMVEALGRVKEVKAADDLGK